MNQQLSWRTIVGYSLGDVANNFAFAMGALFLLSYYTDVAGVGVPPHCLKQYRNVFRRGEALPEGNKAEQGR